MAPRNSDGGSSCKKNFPVEDSDVSIRDIVPCLLHKKHKVVKLVKNQMQKINEEGLICSSSGTDVEEIDMRRIKRQENLGSDGEAQGSEYEHGQRLFGSGLDSPRARLALLMATLLFLLTLLILILLMVWISAGPLSRTIPHTPVPVGSFVRTEGICNLEKKYLLRWSKPEYFE